MNKTLLFLIFITLFLKTYARPKALAQFYPPPTTPHPQTGHSFRCGYVRYGKPDIECDNPGIYFIFSINSIDVLGVERSFPLRYIGRSVTNALKRIDWDKRKGKYHEADIVCFMEFPRDVTWNNNNDVITIEQTLLSAFASTGNAWDQNGFAEWRGDTYIMGDNGLGFDLMRSFYTMDITLPISNLQFVPGHEWDDTIENHILHMQVKDNKVDIDSIFSEGIPYEGGYVIDSNDDYCSTNKTKFKKHSANYLKRIEENMDKLENKVDVENTQGNDALNDCAELGAKVGGVATGIAVGAAAATAVANGTYSEQALNWGKGLFWEVGQEIKNFAKEGFGDWKNGVRKIGNDVKSGASEGGNAWKDGAGKLSQRICEI
ncbi:hypothetical protein DICPUDRAFT_81828 [Dictyostelium purpureum]|uniref:Uncharacterized protein n=1 Tax=Dictyostelium purpureum TaxID=5786 RepID=F0ZUQ1_DICPU|nr:uncharacterized protein DICPUDRAFT_81828 [Dictyostelium purpureum]EGC32345.1 hypothetical protein DICPUDRAFT_81828 [Dictyostelium purpureum]|eukprot:XP_003291147.1 hypothetical protein DICPUDRAFT_81828 [Dictyostelium purpureum]